MGSPKTIHFERIREYPLPLEKVWQLLAHTDRLHHMARLSSPVYGPHGEERDQFSLPAHARSVPPWVLRWREHPYDWVRHRSFCVLREFEAGPLSRYVRGVVLEPTEKGTSVRAFAEITPRWQWLAPLVRLRANWWVRSIHRYCSAFFLIWTQRKKFLFPRRANDFVKIMGWERRLRRFASTAGETGFLLERLKQHLTHGTDEEVTHMRPRDLAEAWARSEADVVRLFLYAASEGLLRPEWTLLCPRCRWPAGAYEKLDQVPQNGHCDRCTAPFSIDFDACLDLRFSVHGDIRETAPTALYRPEPAVMPHVLAQRFLPPGEVLYLTMDWKEEERYLCRTLRTHHVCRLSPTQRPAVRTTKVRLNFTGGGWGTEGVLFRPGQQELEIRNSGPYPLVVVLERSEGDVRALSAREVLVNPDFRNLYPREAPASGLRFPVSYLAFLVVGVRDATDFIAERGDKTALTELHRYLTAVAREITTEGGILVRVLGDTVLAAFLSPDKAVSAAFHILESPEARKRGKDGGPLFSLNLSLHGGPALVLSRGGQLDFFGEAVHRTFQIGQESRGGDLILSQALFDDKRTQQVLLGRAFDHESREVFRNGPSGGFRICQILPVLSEWSTPRKTAEKK